MSGAFDRGIGDRALVLDAGAITVISVAVCLAADRLWAMSALVPTVLLARMVIYARLPKAERLPMRVELAFFGVCLALGAFNDWNSVVHHRIYDYRAPVFFPELTTIPLWMLLSWGMILRFVTTLGWWRRLGPLTPPSDVVRLPGRRVDRAWLKVAVLLGLVLITRQLIYRFYLHPIASWLPFLIAGALYFALFESGRRDRILGAAFLLGGPLVEIAYIQLGDLHRYHLGWFGGVPLWIVLWWVVAALTWKDLSSRVVAVLTRVLEPSRRRDQPSETPEGPSSPPAAARASALA